MWSLIIKAIRNIGLGGASNFAPGIDAAFSTGLNDTFNVVARILAVNTAATSLFETDGTTDWLTEATLSCPACATDYALITFEYHDGYSANPDGAAQQAMTVYHRLLAGTSGAEAEIKQWQAAEPTISSGAIRNYNYNTYYYLHTLTSAEKTSGFNVKVQSKAYRTGSSGLSYQISGLYKSSMVIGIQ